MLFSPEAILLAADWAGSSFGIVGFLLLASLIRYRGSSRILLGKLSAVTSGM